MTDSAAQFVEKIRQKSWAFSDISGYASDKKRKALVKALSQYAKEVLQQAAKLAEAKECSIARGTETCQCDVEIAAAIRSLATELRGKAK